MSVVLCTLICFIILHAGDTKKVVFTTVSSDILDNILLYFIRGPTIHDYISMKLEDGLALSSCDGFDVQRETVFHFHGWRENPGTENDSGTVLGSVVAAFLQRNTSNMVLFVYANLVQHNNYMGYLKSVANASPIGTAIGEYLQQYTPAVQPLELLHMISFSLGSQIMSKAAQTYGAGTLHWLTAMDPAGPYYTLHGVNHLTSADGVFLDVIHTDIAFYGDYRSVGHVDIFPNMGTRMQPACATSTYDPCGHRMSYKYYAAAILNPDIFPAKRCTRVPFVCNPCNCLIHGGETTYIGYNVNKSARGNFYLNTSDKYPYGRGVSGMDDY